MIELPDSELIQQVKEGSENAFENLLRRYEPLIAKIARKYYVRGYDTEDFYQVGTVAFYRAVLSFEEKEDSTFYGYVLSCVRNEIISQFRKQSIRIEYATELEEIATVMESCSTYTIETSEVVEEERDTPLHSYRTELKELLSKQFFSSLERKCLEGFMGGFSYSEIAEKHGIEIKTVDNALMRIRAKLKQRHATK